MNALHSDCSNGNGMMDWNDVIRSDEDFSPTPFDTLEEECPDMDCYAESAPTEEYIPTAPDVDKKAAVGKQSGRGGLPSVKNLSAYKDNVPQPPEELIAGVLRRGHKMILTGPSKAGKSFLAMELAIALAEGITWLGFKCSKGRVLYVNLEIDGNSCIKRFFSIYKALGIEPKNTGNIDVWNLRGKAKPLDKLLPDLIEVIKAGGYDLVIVDPIYKILTGEENSASDMSYLANQFDRICDETGSAVAYAHHHSKGKKGSTSMHDRGSGSGVFARDPDAILDIIPLQVPDAEKAEGVTAWRMESSLREFPDIKPVNFYFQYPIHTVDTSGALEKLAPEGSPAANLAKSPTRSTKAGRRDAVNDAFCFCQGEGVVKVSDMADFLDCSDKTVRSYIKEFSRDYEVNKGIVTRKSSSQTPEGE